VAPLRRAECDSPDTATDTTLGDLDKAPNAPTAFVAARVPPLRVARCCLRRVGDAVGEVAAREGVEGEEAAGVGEQGGQGGGVGGDDEQHQHHPEPHEEPAPFRFDDGAVLCGEDRLEHKPEGFCHWGRERDGFLLPACARSVLPVPFSNGIGRIGLPRET
jgi:hypothetical protein